MEHFFESQVRSVNINSPLKPLGSDVTIEQDDTSTIQLTRNGWKSKSKRTKHINVRYFYITDRLKAGDVSRVIYKPTGDMESDYLTKVLQGKSFHAHRKTLMGLDGINEHLCSMSRECTRAIFLLLKQSCLLLFYFQKIFVV